MEEGYLDTEMREQSAMEVEVIMSTFGNIPALLHTLGSQPRVMLSERGCRFYSSLDSELGPGIPWFWDPKILGSKDPGIAGSRIWHPGSQDPGSEPSRENMFWTSLSPVICGSAA